MANALDIDPRIPLVVDLDGTLTVTDTLYESFARLALQQPISAFASLIRLGRGPAAVKRFIAERCLPDPASLPYRTDFMDLIREEKARGREIHLVTAADQAIADSVAAEVRLFASATGSSGEHNLKGTNKLALLQKRFPQA
jgi:hypothetical protein